MFLWGTVCSCGEHRQFVDLKSPGSTKAPDRFKTTNVNAVVHLEAFQSLHYVHFAPRNLRFTSLSVIHILVTYTHAHSYNYQSKRHVAAKESIKSCIYRIGILVNVNIYHQNVILGTNVSSVAQLLVHSHGLGYFHSEQSREFLQNDVKKNTKKTIQ